MATSGLLCALIYLLALIVEGVEIDNMYVYFKTWKNEYHFALY